LTRHTRGWQGARAAQAHRIGRPGRPVPTAAVGRSDAARGRRACPSVKPQVSAALSFVQLGSRAAAPPAVRQSPNFVAVPCAKAGCKRQGESDSVAIWADGAAGCSARCVTATPLATITIAAPEGAQPRRFQDAHRIGAVNTSHVVPTGCRCCHLHCLATVSTVMKAVFRFPATDPLCLAGCCCWTSRLGRWTRRCGSRCGRACATSSTASASPPSSLRTTRRAPWGKHPRVVPSRAHTGPEASPVSVCLRCQAL